MDSEASSLKCVRDIEKILNDDKKKYIENESGFKKNFEKVFLSFFLLVRW